MSEDFFIAPAFEPSQALLTLKRQLREARLTERGAIFELKGQSVIELTAGDATIEARLVKRPAHVPDWDTYALKTSADVRKFVDEVRKRLTRWTEDDT